MSYILQNFPNLRLTYHLKEYAKTYHNEIQQIHELSLDNSRPFLGMKPDKGLYNSPEWWDNIAKGIIPSYFSTGKIIEIFCAGQDNSGHKNSFTYQTDTGYLLNESMYYLNHQDKHLFQIGKTVVIFYATLEYKNPNETEYLDTVIEMAISK